MNRPVEPILYAKLPEKTKKVFISEESYLEITLKEILDKLNINIQLDYDVNITSLGYECFEITVKKEVPNLNYEKELEEYNQAVKDHEEAMKNYGFEVLNYNAWLKNEMAIKKAKMENEVYENLKKEYERKKIK